MSRLIYIVWYPVEPITFDDGREYDPCDGIDSVWATREMAEAWALLKGFCDDEPEACVTEWAVRERMP